MSEQEKDQLITFRSTVVGDSFKKTLGVGKEGRQRVQLYMSSEEALVLAEQIIEQNSKSELGIKLDMFLGLRQKNDSNITFVSTFGFVKETQSKDGSTGVKPKQSQEEIDARIKELKAQQNALNAKNPA